jgi:hypothetical protein
MDQFDETVVLSTRDAAWLPVGGTADVVLSSKPPAPTLLVRLLLRRGNQVFCVPRAESGKLDLPTLPVPRTDPDGRATAAALADRFTGSFEVRPLGFVRNRVPTHVEDYPWPTPLAHFAVWASDADPVTDGDWVSVTVPSVLSERHWFALVGPPSAR